jgi:hypothetical protein
MNKFLAEAAGALNVLVALVLIVGGAILGASADAMGRGGGLVGMVLGAVGGAILAVLVCGGLAILIAIRDELRALRLALGGAAPAAANADPSSGASAVVAHAVPAATATFEGREIPLRTANDRQFAVLDDGRVLLKTKTGDIRAFDDLEGAQSYTGAKLA